MNGIAAELREIHKDRDAIYILADRHGCTYTDICLAIGKTREFRDFCNFHQRQKPGKKPPTPQDVRMSQMYADGETVREIAASEGINEQTVYKRLAKSGVIANKRKKVTV
jgi:DNA-binding NarL/FixJ family response regulator